MTIIETAKFNGLDPQAYLAAIFARLDELLPWNWTPAASRTGDA